MTMQGDGGVREGQVSLADQIAQIVDRSAIQDLVHLYAFNVRKRSAVNNANLFTADATFETRDGEAGNPASVVTRSRLVGRDAIITHISTGPAVEVSVCPSITNLLIEIDGDTATSTCLMSAVIRPGGQQMHGEYSDSFRLDAGAWRFRSRVYTMFHTAEA
jgi:SnoaL-like domain